MVEDVDERTQRRVSPDTPPKIQVVVLLISLVLHILPFPVYLLSGMFHWFGPPPSELPDHVTIIPIDLMLGEGTELALGEPAVEVAKPAVATLEEFPESLPAEPVQREERPEPEDAGVPIDSDAAEQVTDAADEVLDGGVDPLGDAEVDVIVDVIVDALADAVDERDVSPAVEDAAVLPEVGPRDGVFSPDAGVASTDFEDAGATKVGVEAGVIDTGLGVEDAGREVQPHRPIRDPIGLSGDAKRIAPKDPNVSLLIYPERIRDHRLAIQFAPTLTKLRNWRNFFGGTELDPIRDTDRILLAGPQLRDSSRVVAVVRYNVPQERVRSAIDVVVKRSGSRGQWEKKRVPVAKAHVDGAERYFVMIAPSMLVVVPPDGLEQALQLPRNLRFPSTGNEAVVLFLKYPANAFRDLPVRLPTSVEWMRFSLTLNPKGGVDARLEAKDKDPESAAKNAPNLTEVINKAMVLDLIFTKRRLLDPVTFRAEGDRIHAETHVTEAQLRHILSFMAAKIEQVDREVPAPARSR